MQFQPALDHIVGEPGGGRRRGQIDRPTDDTNRDTLAMVNGLETLASATYQQMVEKLSTPGLMNAAEMAEVQARFAALVVFDGSRLAAIARRLQLLWGERAVVLPGCLLGVYDLGRGLCRALVFDADAAASELKRAVAALDRLARDTLVLGDRLYGTAAFFQGPA